MFWLIFVSGLCIGTYGLMDYYGPHNSGELLGNQFVQTGLAAIVFSVVLKAVQDSKAK